MQDFGQLLARLADAAVPFVIVGGYAAVAHGSAYITKDVDICIVLSAENIERMRTALKDLQPHHRMTPQRLSFLDFPPRGQPLNNLSLHTNLGVIDILSSVLGVGDYEQLRENAEMVEVDGRQYPVISLEDLIKAKEAMGRDKDMLTAKELRAILAKRQGA